MIFSLLTSFTSLHFCQLDPSLYFITLKVKVGFIIPKKCMAKKKLLDTYPEANGLKVTPEPPPLAQ